jgi:hypothetical protein
MFGEGMIIPVTAFADLKNYSIQEELDIFKSIIFDVRHHRPTTPQLQHLQKKITLQ